jgi:hypothetical protein
LDVSPGVPAAEPGPGPERGEDVAAADAVLAARAVSEGERIAGLILAAQLDTVGTPRKLPMDLWPDADPDLVAEVWARALAVGVRAGQFMGTPRFYRDKLAMLQRRLEEAGYAAMGRGMGPVLSVAERAPEWHPADGEEGREH